MPTPEAKSIFDTLMASMSGTFEFDEPSREQINDELSWTGQFARTGMTGGNPLGAFLAPFQLDTDPYIYQPIGGGGQWEAWTKKQNELWEANATAQIDNLLLQTDPLTRGPLTEDRIIDLFQSDLRVGDKFVVDWGTVSKADVQTNFNLSARNNDIVPTNTVPSVGNAAIDTFLHDYYNDKRDSTTGKWTGTNGRKVARGGNDWTWMVTDILDATLGTQGQPYFIGFDDKAQMEAGQAPGIQDAPPNVGGEPDLPYEISGKWFTADSDGNFGFDKDLTDSVADGALRAHNLSQSGNLKTIGNSVYAKNQAGEWVLDEQLSSAQALANVVKTSYNTQVYGGQAYRVGSDGSFTLQPGVDIQPGLVATYTDKEGNLWGDYEYGPSKKIEGGEGFDYAKIDPQKTADQLQENVKFNQDLEQDKFDLTQKNTELNYELETAKFNADVLHKKAVLAENAGQFDASLQMQGEAQRESSRATNLQTMLTQNSQQMQALDQIAGFLRSPSDALAASFALTGDADPSGFVSQADLINKQIADYNLGSTAIAKTLNERAAQNQRIANIGVDREGGKDALTPGFSPDTVQPTVPEDVAPVVTPVVPPVDTPVDTSVDTPVVPPVVLPDGTTRSTPVPDPRMKPGFYPDDPTNPIDPGHDLPISRWSRDTDKPFDPVHQPTSFWPPSSRQSAVPPSSDPLTHDPNAIPSGYNPATYKPHEGGGFREGLRSASDLIDYGVETSYQRRGERTDPLDTGNQSTRNFEDGGFAQQPVVVGEDGAELAIPLEDGGMMVLNQNQLGFNPEVLSRNRANTARRGGRYPARNAQNGGIFPVSEPVTSADFAIPGFSEPTFSQRELQTESNRLTPPRARQVTQEFGSGYSPAPMVPFKQEVGGTAGFASPTPGYLAGLTTNEREFLRTNLASRNINLADVEQNAARLFGSTGARSGRRNF